MRCARIFGIVTVVLLVLSCGSYPRSAEGMSRSPDVGEKVQKGTTSRTLVVDGLKRRYEMYVPESFNGKNPVPVILGFHGGNSKPKNFSKISRLNEKVADTKGYVIVYPAGYQKFWHSGDDCCGPPFDEGIDDVAFVRAVLNDVEARLPVDKSRIYAAGFSNGGKMTYRVACTLSDRIAAIVVNASSLGIANCNPSRPLSVLHFHGTADTFHPYTRGRGTATKFDMIQTGAPDTIDKWLNWNQCSAKTEVIYKKGAAQCVAHSQCKNNTEVILCTIEGMGHQWPGFHIRFPRKLAKKLGPSTDDLSATNMLLDFFEKHAMR